LGPQKAKDDPQIRPTINVRIQGNIKKLYTKKRFATSHKPQKYYIGAPKSPKEPKLGKSKK